MTEPATPTYGKAAERLDEIGFDLSQHLVRFDHLDRGSRRVQAQRLAQLVNGAHVHASHSTAAQIQGHTIWFLMIYGEIHTFS